MESTKITALEIENVKRIKAVQLAPAENGLTIIGGNNGQGKTSVLDTIAWALGGDRYKPSNAEREGSVLPPNIKLTLSNGLTVERSGKNSSLKVTDPTGRKAGQQLLNSFVEEFALNLPKFMSASPKDKADTLLRVIGIGSELAEMERREKETYNQRRAIGQIAEQKKKYAAELPFHADLPKEPISIAELLSRQQAILARNAENLRLRSLRDQLKIRLDNITAELVRVQAERDRIAEQYAIAQTAAEDLVDESTEALEHDIADIETINIKIRANLDREKAEQEAAQYGAQYDALTEQLETARNMRRDLLNGARLPLPGLSVEDGNLTYNGKQWDCMSSSEQLRVSTAIVRAINPRCGFVLLDKLEQMDTNTLRDFGAWLEAEGLQAIATRVSTGSECTIIIEDGQSVSAAPVAPVAPITPTRTWSEGVF